MGDLCILGSFVMAIISCSVFYGANIDIGPPICIIAIAMECLVFGFVIGGGQRSKIFNPEFLKKWEFEHKEAFGVDSDMPKGGYPDTGNGRFSNELAYADWYKFNIA